MNWLAHAKSPDELEMRLESMAWEYADSDMSVDDFESMIEQELRGPRRPKPDQLTKIST